MADIELIRDGVVSAIMINRRERRNMLTFSACLQLSVWLSAAAMRSVVR